MGSWRTLATLKRAKATKDANAEIVANANALAPCRGRKDRWPPGAPNSLRLLAHIGPAMRRFAWVRQNRPIGRQPARREAAQQDASIAQRSPLPQCTAANQPRRCQHSSQTTPMNLTFPRCPLGHLRRDGSVQRGLSATRRFSALLIIWRGGR